LETGAVLQGQIDQATVPERGGQVAEKCKRHPVARRQTNQPVGAEGFPKIRQAADELLELRDCFTLTIGRQKRIADKVYEKYVRNFERALNVSGNAGSYSLGQLMDGIDFQ